MGGIGEEIHDLVNGREKLLRQLDTFREVLAELVDLKDNVKHHDPGEYERRKPAAWRRAREVLNDGGDQ